MSITHLLWKPDSSNAVYPITVRYDGKSAVLYFIFQNSVEERPYGDAMLVVFHDRLVFTVSSWQVDQESRWSDLMAIFMRGALLSLGCQEVESYLNGHYQERLERDCVRAAKRMGDSAIQFYPMVKSYRLH